MWHYGIIEYMSHVSFQESNIENTGRYGGTAVRPTSTGYPVLVAKRNPETMVKSCCNLRALGKGKGLAHGLNGR